MALGGDILEFTSSNSLLGSFVFRVKANEGNTYDIGGFEANDDSAQRTGNAEMISQLNGKLGFVQVTLVNDMTKQIVERLKSEQSSLVETTYTFTVINGKTYQGTGRIVGPLVPNVNDSTIPVKVNSPLFAQV